jgi:hypothetical protein
MESNYHNRDFEQFVKQNADQYRMFPSEKVWKGIDNALHTRRRWYGLGLAILLLLTGAGVTWVMISTPVDKSQTTFSQTIGESSAVELARQSATPQQQPKKAAPVKNLNGPLVFNTPAETTTDDNYNNRNVSLLQPVQDNSLGNNLIADETSADASETGGAIVISMTPGISSKPVQSERTRTTTVNNPVSSLNIPVDVASKPAIPSFVTNTVTTNKPEVKETKEIAYSNLLSPWTIESVINSYRRPVEKRKVTVQFYIAPTVSYRVLSENKEFLRSAASSGSVPNFAAYNDVKNVVTHKPDIGLEMGLAARYPLTPRLTVKAGLQLNLSRYDIRAYSHSNEVATIALDEGSGNSISTVTRYRNFNGFRTNWLQNLYYSASAPVGAEWKLIGNPRKTFLGIAATFQPTYTFSDRAFLLSTDYKNYAEVPSLIRRWNMNTSFETFVGYTTNRMKWQIGPQIRYQIRSSFKNQYPVKENLIDFGIKVGVTFLKK